MAENEQDKPLAPAALPRRRINEDEAISKELTIHRGKWINCCGCVSAAFLIIALIIIVLIFTVFHIKDPEIKMNAINIQGLQFSIANLSAGSNITLVVDVSIKNPNVASFKHGNSTTTIYYDNTMIGEGRNPAGKIGARESRRMNVTVNIIGEKILAAPDFTTDVSSGTLTISSYTAIEGKTKILKIFKKHLELKMNCTVTYDILKRVVQYENCRKNIKF